MRAPSIIVVLIALAASAYSQQTYTHVVNSGNINCNATCSVIGVSALDKDPDAIIFVMPTKAGRSNPHPIGAYYMYLKRWAIVNLDGAPIVDGATFRVDYYLNSDANHFVYTVPTDGRACLDRSGLDGDPQAQVMLFPTSSPKRGALYNKQDIRADYDAKEQKWCLATANGVAPMAETAFNTSFTGSGAAVPLTGTPVNLPPATLAPAPLAPLIVIARAQWTIPGQNSAALVPGDCLLINGNFVDPNIRHTDTAIVTGQTGPSGEYLKWTAIVDNGFVGINVCYSPSNTQPGPAQIYVGSRRVNILVVR